MIEELKQLLTLIQQLPDMVMHVLLGFAIYKTIVFLGTSVGIYGTIRLAINKLHDYKVRPKEQVVKYDLGKHFICSDGSFVHFQELILRLRHRRTCLDKDAKVYEYVFKEDVIYLIHALEEKLAREEKNGQRV